MNTLKVVEHSEARILRHNWANRSMQKATKHEDVFCALSLFGVKGVLEEISDDGYLNDCN